MKKRREIPCIFYLYIHSKMYLWASNKEVSKKDLKNFLFQWKIPKRLRPLIIKELEIMGLLKNIKQYIVEIKRPEFNEE
ncbi:MAG: hypothetical protein ACOC3Z_02025, partial [Nanoarchaeota archaeon]